MSNDFKWSDDDLYMFRFFSHYNSDARNENQNLNQDSNLNFETFKEFGKNNYESIEYIGFDKVNGIYNNKEEWKNGDFIESLKLYENRDGKYIYYQSHKHYKENTDRYLKICSYNNDVNLTKKILKDFSTGMKIEELYKKYVNASKNIKWFSTRDNIFPTNFADNYKYFVLLKLEKEIVTRQDPKFDTKICGRLHLYGYKHLSVLMYLYGPTDHFEFIVFKTRDDSFIFDIITDFKNNLSLDDILNKYETETEVSRG